MGLPAGFNYFTKTAFVLMAHPDTYRDQTSPVIAPPDVYPTHKAACEALKVWPTYGTFHRNPTRVMEIDLPNCWLYDTEPRGDGEQYALRCKVKIPWMRFSGPA